MLDTISRETSERLDIFVDLAWRWNQRVNLFACPDRQTLWRRHVLDSLQIIDFTSPLTAQALDMGSGAGFPGLVLAIATGVPFILVESDRRKAAFLREAARLTGTTVDVRSERVERVQAVADLITARALGRFDRLLRLATPLLQPGGRCLFLKGSQFEAEIDEARRHWTMSVQAHPSRTDPTGVVLIVDRISRK